MFSFSIAKCSFLNGFLKFKDNVWSLDESFISEQIITPINSLLLNAPIEYPLRIDDNNCLPIIFLNSFFEIFNLGVSGLLLKKTSVWSCSASSRYLYVIGCIKKFI